MTEILTKLIVDCATGEQIVTPLTEEELAQYELDRQAAEERAAQVEAERLAKESAKASAQAKLTALGLTQDEISALGI